MACLEDSKKILQFSPIASHYNTNLSINFISGFSMIWFFYLGIFGYKHVDWIPFFLNVLTDFRSIHSLAFVGCIKRKKSKTLFFQKMSIEKSHNQRWENKRGKVEHIERKKGKNYSHWKDIRIIDSEHHWRVKKLKETVCIRLSVKYVSYWF